MGKTAIEYADFSWQVVTGCSPVSEGCDNCYAAAGAAGRLRNHPRYRDLAITYNDHPMWTGEVRLNRDVLNEPLSRQLPATYFVAPMGDLFHKEVPTSYHLDVWKIMDRAKQHAFLVLTKRPQRYEETFYYLAKWANIKDPLPNVWTGVSISNQQDADEFMPILSQVAGFHWVSLEPLLGPVDLSSLHCGISWCIIGAESGPRARPMNENWVREIIYQCKEQEIPIYYKQQIVNGKKVSTPQLNGRQHLEFPKAIAMLKESSLHL